MRWWMKAIIVKIGFDDGRQRDVIITGRDVIDKHEMHDLADIVGERLLIIEEENATEEGLHQDQRS